MEVNTGFYNGSESKHPNNHPVVSRRKIWNSIQTFFVTLSPENGVGINVSSFDLSSR